MSEQPSMSLLPPIPLMTPERARDRARLFQAFAVGMEREGDHDEAARAERKAAWWLQYAVALATTAKMETN